jgi:hypothetical protein
MTVITMSRKELARLQTLVDLAEGRRPLADAAAPMGVGQRQAYRLLSAFRSQGADGVISRRGIVNLLVSRQRGWLTGSGNKAIAAWKAEPRTTHGGQPRYSALAITTALTFRVVFRLALRQTEGLIGSILDLLGLDLTVPDHSTLGRRAETLEMPRSHAGSRPVHLLVDSTGLKLCGAGEWLVAKHGSRTRRSPPLSGMLSGALR